MMSVHLHIASTDAQRAFAR